MSIIATLRAFMVQIAMKPGLTIYILNALNTNIRLSRSRDTNLTSITISINDTWKATISSQITMRGVRAIQVI